MTREQFQSSFPINKKYPEAYKNITAIKTLFT